ncbi:unnamed protein product, partial [Nesidiocoris tenuis]
MFITVRNTIDSSIVEFELSRNDDVSKLRKMVQEAFGVAVDRQRLIYMGKLVGDIVDVIDARSRGWHEGRINEIVKCEDEVYYKVSFLANSIEAPLMVTKTDIRPVARETIDPENVKPSDVVMINYNREEPNNRGHWYCPSCKTDTTEISVTSQKRQVRIPQSSRDWGKGMACVGRSQVCEIVDKQHFGPIPGVDVGTMWRYRIQCSESGVHRPPVSGIHGKANIGAFSIVFAGGYEADDRGDEFVYTGAGGRDLSGNKRTNKQSCDQTLTRENRALALNCAAKFNENGAEAKNWQEGKPVRVVRSYKLRKQSQFAPAEGLRYDGVYKVVKYYQAKGESGFFEWRYLMRRDDESPAPWTKAGKARIEALGLSMP